MTLLSSRLCHVHVDPADLDAPDRRREVLEVAARILAEDGPHGLSLRRVAAAAGASTQIVYTLFGGKPGLADALYTEGFQRLGAAMDRALAGAAQPGDPERLLVLGRAYRSFAAAEPAFFSVMFGRSIPGFTARPATRAACRALTFGRVVEATRECVQAGALVAADPEELARACWAVTHGVAALEAAGLLGADNADADAVAELALRAPLDAYRTGRPPRARPGSEHASAPTRST
jgi:AcrR family transcriptional regulator